MVVVNGWDGRVCVVTMDLWTRVVSASVWRTYRAQSSALVLQAVANPQGRGVGTIAPSPLKRVRKIFLT